MYATLSADGYVAISILDTHSYRQILIQQKKRERRVHIMRAGGRVDF